MTNDDLTHDLGKTVDTEELLLSFAVELPREYTEAERAVKKGLSSLRKMRKTLTDLSQIRKAEKPRIVKPGEKAKEEAMQLLRSGAISLDNKKERQTFKRKPKELDEEDSSVRSSKKSHLKDKQNLYGNFLRGPKLYPQYSSDRGQRAGHLDDAKPFDSSDLGSASALLEAAASKRKQQLIALSEEETEDVDNVVQVSAEPGSPSSPTDERLPDSSNRSHNISDSETTLHVGYHNVSSSFIRDLFKPFGTITRIKISDHLSHAYVTMETREMAEKALELDHQMVNNRLLRVSYARKQFTPRRGFGRKSGPFSPKPGFNRPGRYGPNSHNFPTFHDPQSQSTRHDPSRDLVTYNDLLDDE